MRTRLLHVSDLHFCTIANRENLTSLSRKPFVKSLRRTLSGPFSAFAPRGHAPELAEALARFAHFNKARLDAILISGDLATTGATADLVLAAEYLDRPGKSYTISSIQSTLYGSVREIVISPGNHDRFADNGCAPGSSNFDTIFAGRWGPTPCRVKGVQITSGPNDVIVVSVDYCLRQKADQRGLTGYWGQGRAYSDVTSDAVSLTSKFRQSHPNAAIIWMVHFPPIACNSNYTLLGFDSVIQAACSVGIQVILSGHLHRSEIVVDKGLSVVLAGSACCPEMSEGNWAHVVDFEVVGGRICNCCRANLKWDAQNGDFAFDSRTTLF